MLVLTRRPHEHILIPSARVHIQVAAARPGVVRVAIDAPPEVTILRGELPDRAAEWGPPAPPPPAPAPGQPAHQAGGARRRPLDRCTRQGLRHASTGLGLARLLLGAGLTRDAQAALDSVHDEIQDWLRHLEGRDCRPRRTAVPGPAGMTAADEKGTLPGAVVSCAP